MKRKLFKQAVKSKSSIPPQLLYTLELHILALDCAARILAESTDGDPKTVKAMLLQESSKVVSSIQPGGLAKVCEENLALLIGESSNE